MRTASLLLIRSMREVVTMTLQGTEPALPTDTEVAGKTTTPLFPLSHDDWRVQP